MSKPPRWMFCNGLRFWFEWTDAVNSANVLAMHTQTPQQIESVQLTARVWVWYVSPKGSHDLVRQVVMA